MTPDDIKAVVDAMTDSKVLLSYPQLLMFVVLSGMAAFVGAYLKQKAQGLATKEDIRTITIAAEEIKAKISQKTALEQKVLFDRYELASSVEQGIIECATQINKLRLDKGTVPATFVVNGDIVSLTSIYERIATKRWLLGDSFSRIMRAQADLLVEMVKDLEAVQQDDHAKRYGKLADEFHNEMIGTFSTNKIIN